MDLWSNFDHDQPVAPLASAYEQARRLTERGVISVLRSWLLQDYVPAYCRSLAATRIFRRCYWVDALGASVRSTPEIIPGTNKSKGRRKSAPSLAVHPVLRPVIELARQLDQEERPIALYGLLLEASSRRGERRVDVNTFGGELPKESGFLHTSWLQAAPSILQEIEPAPAIFLLNPFGPTLFAADDLQRLFQRTVPTELFFLLSHKQLLAQIRAALHTPAQALLLTALLRSDRWKTQTEESGGAVDKIIELLIAVMQRSFQLPVQRIALPFQIRAAYLEEVPYTLLFATRRQDSLLCMNDAICSLRLRLSEQSQRGVLGEEWFIAQQHERDAESWQQLYQSIQQQGRTQRIRRWPDLRQQQLVRTFGAFTVRDYDAVILQLIADGIVRCQWRRASSNGSDAERIPGNEDMLTWR